MSLLKEPGTPPLIGDLLQVDWFLDEEFLNVGEQILKDLERPLGHPYRDYIEHRRAEIKDLCRRVLDAMARSEPRTVLFALPLEEMRA